MYIEKSLFGTLEGQEVYLFTLRNDNQMEVKLTNYGCAIVGVSVPDRGGNVADVVLGCDTLEDYTKQTVYHGAVAGRHANRIEGGTFTLGDKTYQLFTNDSTNHLHGGAVGFDKRVWQSEEMENGVRFTYLSPDGEEGYPGNLEVKVEYTLNNHNELVINYIGISDADTVLNLTNHAYFNLKGHNQGHAVNQKLKLHANQYTLVDERCCVNGEVGEVEGTPMDFREFHVIGERINEPTEQLQNGGGYDHNWVLDKEEGKLALAAELWDEESGRILEVYTTTPGIQFYSGNFLTGTERGKAGYYYQKRDGICLETQYFPNALKHTHFKAPILKKGDIYQEQTRFKFGIR